MIIVRARQLDRVIVTSAARGRIEALHARGPRRIRKKYARAIVFLRPTLTREHLPGLLDRMRDSGVMAHMSPKAWRRFCRALRRQGIDARVERPQTVKFEATIKPEPEVVTVVEYFHDDVPPRETTLKVSELAAFLAREDVLGLDDADDAAASAEELLERGVLTFEGDPPIAIKGREPSWWRKDGDA